MNRSKVKTKLESIETELAETAGLPESVQGIIGSLLNLVESLNSEVEKLTAETKRLQKVIDDKKKPKTTENDKDDSDQDIEKPNTDHSSETDRKKVDKPSDKPASDRRTFKDLEIHRTIQCPVDPKTLPPDARPMASQSVIVQDIEIKAVNICFEQEVYYSEEEKKYFRGSLPAGYDHGDFGADLRALVLSLKYCAGTSEPKILEFLENFGVQISAGSISNILTKTSAEFEQDYSDLLIAGLESTPYQQTDDTSAKVNGKPWHTHILCNPFYTLFSTRSNKDRLSILRVLQNTDDLHFLLNQETLEFLQSEFEIPKKWLDAIADLGPETQYDEASLKVLLDNWFGEANNKQTRTTIEQAAAIIFYRQQTDVPRVLTLVCDNAPQFKLLSDHLALCWIHEGRHYKRLSPVVASHAKSLNEFLDSFWNYYARLQAYRDDPSDEGASRLRLDFNELFSKRTGYDDLDDRIAKTKSNGTELLTVLNVPEVPLHNNASELGARVSARRRDVSLHSRSVHGARAMDVFTTIVQTSKKLGVSAYEYFRDRLARTCELPSLANTIKIAAEKQLASG